MNDKEQIEIQRKCKRPCNKCKVISNKTQQQKENDVHAKKASFKTEDVQTSSEITLKMNESKLTLLNPKTSEVATKISGEPVNQADKVLPKKETAPIESVEIILEDKLSMSEAVEDTDMENAEKDSIKKKSEGKIDMKFDVKKEEYEDLSMDIHKRFHKIWDIASSPNYQESHLVLATQYLVDDLPIELFEVLASLIEEVTKKPVVILHQRLPGRRIASELVDIAVMPPDENWRCGELLPASFVFEHDRNKDNTPHIYAEIIVAKDRPSHIKSIMDLRGCICAMTRKHNSFSAAGLLLDELRSKGENINFFSTILEAASQIHVLDMIKSKQADVGIVDSSVFFNYRVAHDLEFSTLEVLDSLGPMPPYRIMIKRRNDVDLFDDLSYFLQEATDIKKFQDMLSLFNVSRFAYNCPDYYNDEQKSIETEVPYY